VNEKNEVIGARKRAEARVERLIVRSTYSFIKNSKGLFYVQKRSKLKAYCPEHFDSATGGLVAYNESFEETNRREVEEEMGIPSTTPMEHLFTFFYEDENVRCFGDVWELVYDGKLTLQEEEVESVHMMSAEEIIRRIDAGEKFAPDSAYAFKEYIKFKPL
jgi:isopentenyldiphosphate isomerase